MVEEDPESKPRRRRRRRRRNEELDRRGFASVLPQLLTTANLAAGFFAIVKASSGDVLIASYAIFIAAVFDILDGRAARMTGNVSRFGAEYDSIADTVSFGVAPAILAFHAGDFASLGWAGWVMAFVYTACASLRLARFNVSAGRYQGRFDGMPTPAGAGMVVSAVWFNDFLVGLGLAIEFPTFLLAVSVMALGLLMVSPIPYHSFKNVRFGQSYSATVIPVMISILLILQWQLNFFLIGLAYVISGPAGLVWRWRTGRELEPMREPSPFDLENLSIDKLGLSSLGRDAAETHESEDGSPRWGETHDSDSEARPSQRDSTRNVTPIAARRAVRDSSEGETER